MKKLLVLLVASFALSGMALAQSFPDITDTSGVSVGISVPTFVSTGPLKISGGKQSGTTVTVPSSGCVSGGACDFSFFVGSDNLLHCQLSSALGGGSCGYSYTLPAAGASTLGGVNSKDCSSGGQFIQKINTDGSETCAAVIYVIAGTDTSSTANVYTVPTAAMGTCPVSHSAIPTGMTVMFTPHVANTITHPTLDICGFGSPDQIWVYGDAPLATGVLGVGADLITFTQAILVFDGARWQLQDPESMQGPTVTHTTALTNNHVPKVNSIATANVGDSNLVEVGTLFSTTDSVQFTNSSPGAGVGTGMALTSSGLTAGDAYYVGSGGLALAKADASSTIPAVCIAVSTTICIYNGVYQFSSSQSWTAGNIVYVSDATGGALVTTAPSTSGHFVQRVGIATAADTILWMPSLDVGGIQ